jgi:Cys-tRNA(Pro)/Cys-tRNA(Cys) deacylase
MTPAVRAAEKARIAFSLHKYSHDPKNRAYGEEAADRLGFPAEQMFKTLVVDLGVTLAVAIVPVPEKLNLKACASAFGAKRAEMADPKHAERSTGYILGGISPLGQKKRLPTTLHASAFDYDAVYVSAGRRGLEIELAPADLESLTNAVVATLV